MTGVAVRLPGLLLEHSLRELTQTESAHEMLGVEPATHGRDAAAGDGGATRGTQRPLPGVVVLRAQGTTVQLQETAIGEGLQTVLREGGWREREGGGTL